MVFGVGYKQLLANKDPFAGIHYKNLTRAIEQVRSKILDLKNTETLTRSAGSITGPKTRGRKQISWRPARCIGDDPTAEATNIH